MGGLLDSQGFSCFFNLFLVRNPTSLHQGSAMGPPEGRVALGIPVGPGGLGSFQQLEPDEFHLSDTAVLAWTAWGPATVIVSETASKEVW